MEDLEVIADGIERALGELTAAADEVRQAGSGQASPAQA